MVVETTTDLNIRIVLLLARLSTTITISNMSTTDTSTITHDTKLLFTMLRCTIALYCCLAEVIISGNSVMVVQ